MNGSAVSLAGVGKDDKHFTLDDVSLELPEGSIMGFIGANGAGKSTTIRILMGLIHQDRGRVRVLDNEMPAGQVAAKREIGFVSDDMRLYPGATIAWHMSFITTIFPAWDATRLERPIATVLMLEVAAILALLGSTYRAQSRKRDFI